MTAKRNRRFSVFFRVLTIAARNSVPSSATGPFLFFAQSEVTLTSRTVKLNLLQGLHLRACSKVVALVGSSGGQILIRNGDKTADASSIFDLLQLVAVPGSELVLEGNGEGVEAVLDAIEDLFAQTSVSGD